MPVSYFALNHAEGVTLPRDFEVSLERVLPFAPDRKCHAEHGSSHLWAWVKDEDLSPVPAWHATESGAAVVAGLGLNNNGALLSGAALLSGTAIEEAFGSYHGEWSACALESNGSLSAMASDLGMEHVYWTEQPTFRAISNRARLLWAALSAFNIRTEPDFPFLGMLLSSGYPFCTEATAVRGVRWLTTASRLEFRTGQGHAELRELDVSPLFGGHPEPPDWNVLARCLRTNVRWLHRVKSPIIAALTGGKDSRLVLAALCAEGLEKRAEFYLSAPPEHADFLVAQAISKELGLAFERKDAPSDADLPASIRRHVAFTEGALNAWDLKAGTTYRPQVGLHGLLGEVYRGRRGPPLPREILPAAQAMMPSKDPCGIVCPGIRHDAEKRVAAWLQERVADSVPWDRLRDAFYLRQRVPRWAGQARLRDGLNGMQVNPLYHPAILRAYGALSEQDRVGERIHFELIYHLSPELTKYPFADDQWDAAMVSRSSAPTTATATPCRHLRQIMGTGWQTKALRQKWGEIRDAISSGLTWLDDVVIPKRAKAMMDAAEILLGVETSARAAVRVRLRNPVSYYRAGKHLQEVVQQILGLLTLVTLRDELEADVPTLVRVVHQNGPSTPHPKHAASA